MEPIICKWKGVYQQTSCQTSLWERWERDMLQSNSGNIWTKRKAFSNTGTSPAVLCTLAIIPPCPPAQPSPPLCWLLRLQRCPLYEPACQPWGLPRAASSHSAPGPPASWEWSKKGGSNENKPFMAKTWWWWKGFSFNILTSSGKRVKQFNMFGHSHLMDTKTLKCLRSSPTELHRFLQQQHRTASDSVTATHLVRLRIWWRVS